MTLYAHAAFRVHVLGGRVRLRPRLVLAVTHRSLSDPPLLIGTIYPRLRIWREREARPWFTVRDDLFERGALAALLPPRLAALRRALFSFEPDPFLRRVRCVPATSWQTLRVGQALARLPRETPLEDALPEPLVARLRQRARDVRAPTPRTAGDPLQPEYVDVLWETLRRDEHCGGALPAAWRRRAADATRDLRQMLELVRQGAPFVVFPEGRVSRDGSIGPVRRGVRALVRSGRPDALLPIAISYDPLASGRTSAYVSIGDELVPPQEPIEQTLLAALRRAMPLTRGQVLSRMLLEAAGADRSTLELPAVEETLAELAAEAARERRPVAPDLLDLDGALAALERRGLAVRRGAAIALDAGRCGRDAVLARLRREFESAREPAG